jgi:dihydroneopterin aldolase
MDTLSITALAITTRIGVHEWEQRISQRLFLDISISFESRNYEEDLSKTIDYDKLCQQVTSYVESNQFHLIETVAERVAELIKTTFHVSQVTVSVSKPDAIKNARDVRISLAR